MVGCIQDPKPIFAVPNFEIGLVNTVNQELVASYAVRVEHVWDLVVHVELPIGDCQRKIEGAGRQRRRIGRVIDNVQAC